MPFISSVAARGIYTPPGVPGPPQNLYIAPFGSGRVLAFFDAPTYSGATAITSYTINYGTGSISGASSPIDISGLTNAQSYTFYATATNSVGTSGRSNTVTETPIAGTLTRTSYTAIGSGTWTAPATVKAVEYLVVGGGGGGGGAYDTGAGGGGGGGLALSAYMKILPSNSYSYTVGDGGAGGIGTSGSGETSAQNGGSSMFNTVSASGGGLGGGSLVDRTGTGGAGGNALTLTAPLGGKGGRSPQNNFGSGGGGGMSSAGLTATSTTVAAGGSGIVYTIVTGSNTTYSTGGPGSRRNFSNTAGSAGAPNTGNGGGGAGTTSGNGRTGGKGGSGIVALLYYV